MNIVEISKIFEVGEFQQKLSGHSSFC